MKNLIYIFVALLLVACNTKGPVVVPTDPVLPVVEVDGAIVCRHKYDDNRSFAYYPPVQEYTEVMFGEPVTTYTFTLVDGNTHVLSDAEEDNYDCKAVE